ncbi:uncharacterized protein LOC129573806, partial [Sitodiplosis mosellana]|uniref:uncharacterized protein LOC129573806 n=1 Tax=Sitodiplosis mosellana TaxID=263140 RepID=UPI0024441AC2
ANDAARNGQNAPVQPPEAKSVWLFQQDFGSADEFSTFLETEGCWSKLKTEHLNKGVKTTYRCNDVKRRGEQCNAGVYTLHGGIPNDPSIKLFRKSLDHSCGTSTNRNKSVPDDIQQFIIDQYNVGNKLQAIIMLLRNRPDLQTIPDEKQVKNVIQYYRKKTSVDPDVSIANLKDFVNAHSAVPQSLDDAFIVSAEFSPPLTPDDQKFFRIFYSTKRLLTHATLCNTLHCDGTYKQLIHGFPILVIGITDMAIKFHLTGIGVCSGESTNDYKFLFDSLKLGVSKATDKELRPKAVMGDGAAAISRAVQLSFEENVVRMMCFYHVMANVEKRSFNKGENKADIKDDIRTLRHSYDQATFDAGAKLFLKKWQKKEKDFLAYFQEQYLKNLPNWYFGASKEASNAGVPGTNNATENFNKSMKQTQTNYERKVIGTPNHFTKDDTEFFVFSGERPGKVTSADVLKFSEQKWKNFKEFAQNAFQMHRIQINRSEWKQSVCTCPAFGHDYICKHIVHLAYKLALLEPPMDLLEKTTSVSPKKNPRGRPRKATPALIRD